MSKATEYNISELSLEPDFPEASATEHYVPRNSM